MTSIFIPGNVPSSKNSKTWTGKFLVNSNVTTRYIKTTESYWQEYRPRFLEAVSGLTKPYRIGFLFVRDSRRRFDYINPMQSVADLMVKHKWIEDDNADILLPYFEPYQYSKEHPGVYILI